jgi:hypothetical protein
MLTPLLLERRRSTSRKKHSCCSRVAARNEEYPRQALAPNRSRIFGGSGRSRCLRRPLTGPWRRSRNGPLQGV